MKNIFLISIIFLFVFSCKKDEEAPLYNSVVYGNVKLYDDLNNAESNAGMNVTVSSSGLVFNDITDENGEFRLENVPFSSYYLGFSKSGYGEHIIYKSHRNEHFEDHYANLELGKISTTKVVDLEFTLSYYAAQFTIYIDPAGNAVNPRYVRMLLHHESPINQSNYSISTIANLVDSNQINMNVSYSSLLERGFSSGDICFVKVYGESHHNNEYVDPELMQYVFPNLSPYTVSTVSFYIP